MFPWRRFWVPRTENVILAEDGYLLDPESGLNPTALSMQGVGDVPCLVLLGEPGIGKSSTLKYERQYVEETIGASGDDILWFDLRSYGSEDRLVRNLFENEAIGKWSEGLGRLHLFLDSFDECLLRIDTLAALLADELARFPIERLRLRIASRTADWPAQLEGELRRLWGEDQVSILELAPLRRADVMQAAQLSEIDPESFVLEVGRLGVVPLAIKPITLTLLINEFKRSGSLPSSQAELYLKGCLTLCEEPPDSNRRAAGLASRLTSGQRLSIASRVAAITVLGNRYAVWTGVDLADVPQEDVVLANLSGGTEQFDGMETAVTDEALRDVLGTGLFTSRGSARMGWAHQTYAEFLTAWYLNIRHMTVERVLGYITNPGDHLERIVPQLREVAAWLANMSDPVWDRLVRSEPQLLLGSDVATMPPRRKAALVDGLLAASDMGWEPAWGGARNFARLSYPGLAGHLRAVVLDRARSDAARRLAIDIADACDAQDLQEDLAGLALNESERMGLRIEAAYSVARMGNEATKARLRPLAITPLLDDPDDELKACGLSAIWPARSSVEELFAILTPPKNSSLAGLYARFLGRVTRDIGPEDLPVALRWAGGQASRGVGDELRELAQQVLEKAVDYVERDDVLAAFAAASWPYLRDFQGLFGNRFESESSKVLSDQQRHLIFEALLPFAAAGHENETYALMEASPAIVLPDDMSWLLARRRGEENERVRQTLTLAAFWAFDPRNASHIELVYDEIQHDEALAGTFARWFGLVTLGSPEAEQAKANYKRQSEIRSGPPPLDPPVAERIHRCLASCESGDTYSWWHLPHLLAMSAGGRIAPSLDWDVTKLEGWLNASPLVQERIVTAGKRYLQEHDDNPAGWLGQRIVHWPALAGYRALQLIKQREPGFLESLPAEVWERWVSIIVAYPAAMGSDDDAPHQELVRMAYARIPDRVIGVLLAELEQENERFENVYVLRKMASCWDSRLVGSLVSRIYRGDLKPGYMGGVLAQLLEHGSNEAREYAETLVRDRSSGAAFARENGAVAARVLMLHARDAGWNVLWPAIQDDASFGEEVIESAVWEAERIGFSGRLSEQELSALWGWLETRYPHTEDPNISGVHTVSLREEVGRWRDSVLVSLRDRGTRESVEAIASLQEAFPDFALLSRVLREADENYRRLSWVPIQPAHLIQALGSDHNRLVQTGAQLLDVLVESLRRLDARLQGETPMATFLWDEIRHKVFRPKDEADLSDYIKAHLDQDVRQRGIVVNREVEIRKGEGEARGERTDIHVDALTRGPGDLLDLVKVIIEVKGSWNRELSSAMKAQLVDRYLADNAEADGLYLVGWFDCEQWDEEDPRSRIHHYSSLTEAQAQLGAQATALSSGLHRVRAYVLNTALR